jgi:hypothetical protein
MVVYIPPRRISRVYDHNPALRLTIMTTRLASASAVFLAANLLHGADHYRQGTERLTTEVTLGGTLLTIAAIGTLILCLRHDSRAPLVAAVVGLFAGVGVMAAHLAPHWSALSDSYPDLGVDALAWIVVLAEIGAAFLLAFVGFRELRRESAQPVLESEPG